MTTTYNLLARTNATFRWTRDFSQIASVYDVASSVIRMQARLSAAADYPVYGWSSDTSEAGNIVFDPATGLCVFTAPVSGVAHMPARLVYDCRLELANGSVVALFSGRLSFSSGVTRTTADASATSASGTGDTVFVEGEASTAPAIVPTTITSLTAQAQSARDSAQGAASSAATSASAAAGSASSAATSATAAAQSAQVATSGAASLTPAALAASFAALSPSQTAALAQLLFASLPEMTGGAVPTDTGQAFVNSSGFFVRAG